MQISYQAILNKMIEKVNQAKMESSDTKVREHVQAIKTLCEIILEESNTSQGVQKIQTIPQAHLTSSVPTSTIISPSNTLLEKKLTTDDGANGDSLFDF